MEAIEIKSLQGLCNAVTPENAERLGEDVKQWLVFYATTTELFRQSNPEITKNLKNSEIIGSSFLWTDDGEAEVKGVNFELKDEPCSCDNINCEEEMEEGFINCSKCGGYY